MLLDPQFSLTEIGLGTGLLLAVWASLTIFYLTAFLARLFGVSLELRFVAPGLFGNLAMAVCFGSFFLSKLLEGQPRSLTFGYLGFGALFVAIVLDVVRRGRAGSSSRSADSQDP